MGSRWLGGHIPILLLDHHVVLQSFVCQTLIEFQKVVLCSIESTSYRVIRGNESRWLGGCLPILPLNHHVTLILDESLSLSLSNLNSLNLSLAQS